MLSNFALEKIIFYSFLFFLSFDVKKFIAHAFKIGPITEFNSFFFYLSDVFIFVLLFLFIIQSFRNKKAIPHNKILVFLGSFLVFSFLSLLNAANPLFGFYGILRTLIGIFLLFYIEYSPRQLRSKSILEILSLGGIIQSCIAIGQYLKQSSLGLHYLGESVLNPYIGGVAKINRGQIKLIRAYGTFPHPNILAAFLMISLFSLIVLILKDSQITKQNKSFRYFIRYLGLAIVILGLVLTFSRTFLVLTILSLVIFWIALHYRYLSYRLSRPKINQLMFFVVLMCLGLTLIIWPIALVRLSQTQSLSLRTFYNHEAIQIIKKYPLLGIGFNNFIYKLFALKPSLPSWQYQPVHNIYLLLLAEIGIFGFLSFVAFLSILIKKAFSKIRLPSLEKLTFLIIFLCFLLSGLVDHFFLTTNQGILMFWLTLSLVVR